MTRIYIIESKGYVTNHDGIEYQCADGGSLPQVYTKEFRAISAAKRSVKHYQEKFGYDLVMQTPDYPAVGKNCLYAARLIKDGGKWRQEFRVYKELTWD